MLHLYLFFALSALRLDSVAPMGLCLENYAYPYPVKYITLNEEHQTPKMAYMDVRPEKPNGHTILLLHGKNFCGAYWGQTAKTLAAHGYRVIIPDQIGFGKSSKPTMLQYSFQLLARNTKAILDSAQVEKVVVLGHSMGGMVATRLVLMYPAIVEKFILEDPIGLEDWQLKVPYQSIDFWYQRELGQNYESLKKYELDSYYHGTWSPAYDAMLNIYAGWALSPEYDRIAVPESIRKTMGNYPALGKLTQKKIPHFKLVELPGVGHVPHMEAFDAFIRSVTEFLAK